MNSLLLCLSASAILSLTAQDYSFIQDFRKVDSKRSTDSEKFTPPYCPPLPEVEDGKPKETIDPYCLEEDRRRSLIKIADLKEEIVSLKKEVNEEKNSKSILQSQNIEFYQRIIEDKNEITILKEKIIELNQSVNEEKNKRGILESQNIKLNERVNEEKNNKSILEKENSKLKKRIQEFCGQLDEDGTENIFQASEKGSLNGVKYWNCIDPSSIHAKNGNNFNWTPLIYASNNGHLDIVEFLLSKGVDVDAGDSFYNRQPLMYASEFGHVHVVEALLDKGAKINHQDINKWTSLHLAVWRDHLPVVKLLIERGADRSLRDEENETPVDLAREYGWKSIVDYLSSL